MASFERLQHGGGAVETTLSGNLTSGATTMILTAATGWPDGSVGPFYLVVDPDTANEEKIQATALSGTTLTGLTRGVDGSSAIAHTQGATVRHGFVAVEADEANLLVNSTLGTVTTKGDLIAATSAGALDRLAAGSNGLPLVANSAQATGLQYAALAAGGLASDSVTTAKILDDAVTAAKIAAGEVGTTELAASAVTSAKIADGTIVEDDLADGAVTSAKIANLTVVLGDLSPTIRPTQIVTSSTRPGSPIAGDIIYETDTGSLLAFGNVWCLLAGTRTSNSAVSWTPRNTDGDLFNWSVGSYGFATFMKATVTLYVSQPDGNVWQAALGIYTAAGATGTLLGQGAFKTLSGGTNYTQQVIIDCDPVAVASGVTQTFYCYVDYTAVDPVTTGFSVSAVSQNRQRTLVLPTLI